MIVCTPGKKCTGSINGKEFMYADGSKDLGVTVTVCRTKFGEDALSWIGNEREQEQKMKRYDPDFECSMTECTEGEWVKLEDLPPASTCSAWKALNNDALDGQMRILSDGERVMTGAWEPNNSGGFSWFSEDSKALPMHPTMWMSLPNPPKQNPTDSDA
jgi:hypothetical protein